MNKKNWIIGGVIFLVLGGLLIIDNKRNSEGTQPSSETQSSREIPAPVAIKTLPEGSYSLKNLMYETPAPFACTFGRFTVEMVDSKYKDHKYFKLRGSGMLINSGYLHTNIAANPDVIYAVPKDSPLKNGAHLSVHCITGMGEVPYEGKEREKIDQAAALTEFYRE
jgi:hypothetical protein